MSPHKNSSVINQLWRSPETNAISSRRSLSSARMSVPPFEPRENLVRIPMVDLFEHSIWKLHSINLPTPLAGISPVGEILIASFQPTEVVRVHCFLRLAVGSEKNTVLVIDKEFARPPWLPSKFRLACPKFHIHIG